MNSYALLENNKKGKLYKLKNANDIFSGLGEEAKYGGSNLVTGDRKDRLDNDSNTTTKPKETRSSSVEKLKIIKICKALDGVKIMPICGDIKDLLTKKKYKHMFDHIFLSQQIAQCLEQDSFRSILKPDCSISIETGKYVFPLGTNNKQNEMTTKIEKLARIHEFKPILCGNTQDRVKLSGESVLYFRN